MCVCVCVHGIHAYALSLRYQVQPGQPLKTTLQATSKHSWEGGGVGRFALNWVEIV